MLQFILLCDRTKSINRKSLFSQAIAERTVTEASAKFTPRAISLCSIIRNNCLIIATLNIVFS
jgi:hypothetical protein